MMKTEDQALQEAQNYLIELVNQNENAYFPRTLMPVASQKYPDYLCREAYWNLRSEYILLQQPTGELYLSK